MDPLGKSIRKMNQSDRVEHKKPTSCVCAQQGTNAAKKDRPQSHDTERPFKVSWSTVSKTSHEKGFESHMHRKYKTECILQKDSVKRNSLKLIAI